MAETGISDKNINSIQILRGVAATSVVYWHIDAIPSFGSFGVEIFFVISGFVMALITSTNRNPSKFLSDRISRIVPLYWVLTTGFLIVLALYPHLTNSTTFNIPNYLKSLFFIPYFRENGKMFPLLFVGWTLNYEMFFYACITISLVVSKKHPLILTSIILASVFVLFGKLIDNVTLNAFFSNPQIFEFILGIIAYQVYKLRLVGNVPKYVFFLLGISSYVFMAFAQIYAVPASGLVLYGLPSFLLIISCVELETLMRGHLANFLKSIGDASYATYLSHAFVVDGTIKIVFEKYNLINPYTPFGVSFIVSTALIAGYIIYRTLDKPLSRLCRRKLGSTFPRLYGRYQ